MAAINCELLIYAVVRAEPFHFTAEPEMNLDPVTVRVTARVPADALVGEIELMPGTGFCVVEEDEELLPPPQLASSNESAPIHPAAKNCRNRFDRVFRQYILLCGFAFRLIISAAFPTSFFGTHQRLIAIPLLTGLWAILPGIVS
jgi:hypothetical protein